MANGFLQSLDTKPRFPALAARFWSAPLPADSIAVLRPLNGSANRNRNVRICRPELSSTGHAVEITVLAPAISHARVNPRSPAPACASPLPVAQPVMTTSAPGTRSPAISDVVRNSGSAAIGRPTSGNRRGPNRRRESPRLKAISPCSRLAVGKEHMRGQMDHGRPLLQPAPGTRPAALPDPAIQRRPRLPPPTSPRSIPPPSGSPPGAAVGPSTNGSETGPRQRGSTWL